MTLQNQLDVVYDKTKEALEGKESKERYIHLELYGHNQLMCDKCEKNMYKGDTAVIYQNESEDCSVYCQECWDVLVSREIERRKHEKDN